MRARPSSGPDLYSGMGFILRLVANTLAILIVAWMLDGITVHNAASGILAGVVLALVNAIVKPILVILTLPLYYLLSHAPLHFEYRYILPAYFFWFVLV